MATTLQNLYDLSYALLREDESDSSAYPTSLLTAMFNMAQLDFCSGNIINPVPLSQDLRNAKKGQLPFLMKDAYFSNVAPTYLTADVAIWGATLSVSSTADFPTTGSLYLAGNIITYTGKTSTSFTGCTNVLFAFLSGSQVSAVFSLPTDFMSSIQIIYNNQYKLDGVLYDEVFEQLKGLKNNFYSDTRQNNAQLNNNSMYTRPFYTIKDNTYLILWNVQDTGWMIHLRYEKKPTTLSAVSDLCTIDNDSYCQLILPYLACGELLYNRWEEDRASKLYNHAVWVAKKAYNFYNNTMFEDINWTRVSSDKWGRRLNI